MALVPAEELRSASLGNAVVAVLGYGSQGRAQALNLRDSGVSVIVGLRENSPRRSRAEEDGLRVETPSDAVAGADLVAMLVPDEAQPGVYAEVIDSRLKPGGALVFAHGYNIHYQLIEPRADLDVILVAPSGIGEQVRARYEAGHGTAGFVAVDQDASGQARSRALAYARALGEGRVAVIETTFAEEVETDLFAEQTVLVGGLTELITEAFSTLTNAGYQPEIAYFCCLEEVKLMADLIYEQGLASLWDSISSTAALGGLQVGPCVVNEQSRQAMREALSGIRGGQFAADLAREGREGFPQLEAARKRLREHPIEAVRRRLRSVAESEGVGPGGDKMAS